ncbi:hypothetical protein ANANG_G00296140 [Anguilla anguilla]|uniref:Cytokine receptor-like factor 3 n=1 Tax=Anguilla anguilla TaxID=7936 RepID=A0A9D3RJT2_ANGAN|nr:hypothetical protein ANANG_G00296140 [Anguilla anguilla]
MPNLISAYNGIAWTDFETGAWRMSIETEALLQEAKESIEAAQNYRTELQHRLHGLSQARKQVPASLSTSAHTQTQTQTGARRLREALKRHFQDLQAMVTRLLGERLAALLQGGEAAIRCGIAGEDDMLGRFTKKALQIQLDSLPEVPVLVDVPCLSAQLDDSLLQTVRERVARHASVASHPPVQIEELVERPGSMLVRWCKVDDDFAVQDYRLQFRRSPSSQYEDAYIGKETDYLVLHLDPHTDHQFRVCARGEGRTEWSPWSVPQTGYTTLAPHEWCPGTDGYILSSRRNIAMRSDSSPSNAGVLFTAAGQGDRWDSVGVCVDNQSGAESLQRDKAVCISTNGAVFVNGKEMTNQLPAITTGSTVTFDMEVVNLFPVGNNLGDGGNFKLRVTIGSGNREVVFDWLLDQSVDCLFFGCSFTYPNWKVLVF